METYNLVSDDEGLRYYKPEGKVSSLISLIFSV